MNLRRAASTVLGLVVAFLAVYVAYAHIASIATARLYAEEPEVIRFASSEELARRFEVRKEGPLEYAVAGGVLAVTGKTHEKGAKPTRLEFVGPERALGEARVIMRFRVTTAAAYDVTVGLETTRSGQGGVRVLKFGLQNDVTNPTYGLDGDSLYPFHEVAHNLQDSQIIDLQRRPAFERREEWHEIALRFSSNQRQAFAWVDNLPAGSIRTGWAAGMPVRVIFGVTAREADQPVHVEIDDVGYEPMKPDTRRFDYVDRFRGRIFDPLRWRIEAAGGPLADVVLRPSDDGLLLTGKAQRITTSVPATAFFTSSMGLSSFHLRLKVKVRKLKHSTFYLGVVSTVLGRVFDVGLDEREDIDPATGQVTKTTMNPFVYGHWQRAGMGAAESFPQLWNGDEGTLAMDYDATTRKGRVSINGELALEKQLDIQVREDVTFRFGVNLNKGDAEYDLLVKEFEINAQLD